LTNGKQQSQGTVPNCGEAPGSEENDWRRRAKQAEQHIRLLTERLKGRNRELEVLEQGVVLSLSMQSVWRAQAESEIAKLRADVDALRVGESAAYVPSEPGAGTNVNLPYVTKTLAALFDVMRELYETYDKRRPPKSLLIAHAIDEKLGWKNQSNGEASRSAQTFAAAIKPEVFD